MPSPKSINQNNNKSATLKKYLDFCYKYGIFAIVNGVLYMITTAVLIFLDGLLILLGTALGERVLDVVIILLISLIQFIGSIYFIVRGVQLSRQKLPLQKIRRITSWLIFFSIFQFLTSINLCRIFLSNIITELNYDYKPNNVLICLFCFSTILLINSLAMIISSIIFKMRISREFLIVAQAQSKKIEKITSQSQNSSEDNQTQNNDEYYDVL